MLINNIFKNLSIPQGDEETFEALCRTDNLRIERILSYGQVTPEGKWYDSPDNEWVLLLQGNATLQTEEGLAIDLTAGDYLLIPAHLKHKVAYTSEQPPCIWLAVHFKN